jgi:hypothetical protein
MNESKTIFPNETYLGIALAMKAGLKDIDAITLSQAIKKCIPEVKLDEMVDMLKQVFPDVTIRDFARAVCDCFPDSIQDVLTNLGRYFPNTSPRRDIFRYLMNKYGPCLGSSGISIEGNGGRVYNWRMTDKDYFRSADAEGQWLEADFVDMRVIVNLYAIYAGRYVSGERKGRLDRPLNSYVIEVSNDRQLWTIIDSQSFPNEYRCNWSANGTIAKPRESRYVRVRSTGPNFEGSNGFTVSKWSLYGLIY